MAVCIGCDRSFDPHPRRADTKHCPECEPLRHHRGLDGGRLPVAVLRALGTECAVCGGHVDFKVHAPDPMAPSVDHVVAQSIGGSHHPANLQLCHLLCNQTKHIRTARQDPSERRERQRFYDKQAWRNFAKSVRAEEPRCRCCGDPSECASHIVPLADGGAPFDRDNVEALCRRCRNHKAQAIYVESVMAEVGA